MNKLLRIVTLAFITLISFPLFAQDYSAISWQKSDSKESESYNRITIGYNADIFMRDRSGLFDLGFRYGDWKKLDGGLTLSGFNAQYTHGFSLTNKRPFFLEVGVRVSTGFKSDRVSDYSFGYGDGKVSGITSKLDLTVPVNIAYRWNLGRGISLLPYIGLHLKINLLGQIKIKEKYSEDNYEYTTSFFDKIYDSWWDGDCRWTRVQAGGQVGLGFNFHRLYFGLEYGIDFNKLYTGCTSSNVMANIGINF